MHILKELYISNITKIEKLWYKNSKYHTNSSKYFSENIKTSCFRDRVTSWEKAKSFKCTVVYEKEELIAYVVSTINNSKGEIESLYTTENNRRKKIASELVENHINWFKVMKCRKIQVQTIYLNSKAIRFYQSLNILPKSIILEYKIE